MEGNKPPDFFGTSIDGAALQLEFCDFCVHSNDDGGCEHADFESCWVWKLKRQAEAEWRYRKGR